MLWQHPEKGGRQAAVAIEWPDEARRHVPCAADAGFKSIPLDLENEQFGIRGKPPGIGHQRIEQRHVSFLQQETTAGLLERQLSSNLPTHKQLVSLDVSNML
jgi:hypothetical protein